jgi:hypothetical protein
MAYLKIPFLRVVMSQLVIPRRTRREIQYDLISNELPGFPFDFAQGGEPVEPRVSLMIVLLARNDIFFNGDTTSQRLGDVLLQS